MDVLFFSFNLLLGYERTRAQLSATLRHIARRGQSTLKKKRTEETCSEQDKARLSREAHRATGALAHKHAPVKVRNAMRG
eukprot:scaffold16549_cov117-Isochrysis_galbana.AAC.2